MLRVTLALLILLLVFVSLRMLLGRRKVTLRQFMVIYASVIAGLLLVYLGVTGRLNWLFALLGVALPFISRILPWISRSLGLASLVRRLRAFAGATSGPAAGGRAAGGGQSALDTIFFSMTLDHDTGVMDGNILTGQFSGQRLSSLALPQLQLLLAECQADTDSTNVLTAYLDRQHPNWRDAQSQASSSGQQGAMNEAQAYQILGLEPGASRDMVIAAHRKLMQKFHPDRGGNHFLAAQLNQAKDFLMERM
ncbi:MAG: DnaJ domain-containing protein [Pseudomonadales bacterium]|jgi:hypothetical protein|nr:DnaJ domain-containing protein [Pseudomonadales bacterium]MDP4639502.1 DnaJ domain-containing protein [Pseudomonadales bacterium]MDP4764875.1 DnaJ domain-containing protein [Pseudomonadales bacterium]MDP4876291.1 DnaJ domain-containing protein [Pseudomonadales bacterium]MDP4910263.1 DnaJ domain-containing protein [Pseudomonadales bacterium]